MQVKESTPTADALVGDEIIKTTGHEDIESTKDKIAIEESGSLLIRCHLISTMKNEKD